MATFVMRLIAPRAGFAQTLTDAERAAGISVPALKAVADGVLVSGERLRRWSYGSGLIGPDPWDELKRGR